MTWAYRRMYTVYSDTGNVETNYPVKFTVTRSATPTAPVNGSNSLDISTSNLRSDFADLRFVINNRIVPHYDHTGTGSTRDIYVKIPRLLPDIGTDIYVYYGNPYMTSTISSDRDTITYLNHILYDNLKGITLSGNVTWANVGRAHICPIMKYGMSNYGVLNTQNAFNRPVMGYTIEIPAAFGSGGNTSVILMNGSRLIGVRRSASTTTKIVAEYDMDTVHEITGVGSGFNNYGFHFYNGSVYYSFNGVTYGDHVCNNNNTYIVMMGNSSNSYSEVTADYILMRKSAWSISGELIHFGNWGSEETGGFWCLPYDTTFDNLQIYIDGRARTDDLSYPPTNVSDVATFATGKFDVPNESLQFTSNGIIIGNPSEFNFIHQTPCQSTIFFWIYPETPGIVLDNDYCTVTITESNTIQYMITNVASGTFTNTLTRNEWNAVCITFDNSISSGNATCYTATLTSIITSNSFNKTGTAPSSNEQTTPLIMGNDTAYTSTFNGKMSELMIFNRTLIPEECQALITRTRNGYIYPVMNLTRSIT